MLKFVRWDDTITNERLRMRISGLTKPNPTQPNPIKPNLTEPNPFTIDIRLNAFNSSKIVGRIFMKSGMEVVPLETSPNSCFFNFLQLVLLTSRMIKVVR
jgi:hypothetical protein